MIDFKVQRDGGDEFEVKATTRDVLLWEKAKPGKRAFSNFAGGASMVDMYSLAHTAARRQGLFDGSLQEFEESCELVFEDPEGEADPTQPAA